MNSSENLFAHVKKGDKKAFEVLFKSFYPALCAYANSIIHEEDSAQDIVQEFLFHIWEIKEKLPLDIPMRGYLFKSVHNHCLNYLKHKKIQVKHKEVVLSVPLRIEYEEHYNEPNELHEKLRDSIEKLPPERKKIFIMQRYEELSYKDIAEKLEISIKTVENQIGKALQSLREEFKNYSPILIFALIISIIKYFKI